MSVRKYWIGVASLDHVDKGVEDSFAQVCHGKKYPLSRMKENDVIFYYSPRQVFGSKDRYQCFTAMGRVKTGAVYEFEMNAKFKPYRIDVEFYEQIKHVSIHSLIDKLDFIEDKQHYGEKFRYGHFEISKKDAMTIWNYMKIEEK